MRSKRKGRAKTYFFWKNYLFMRSKRKGRAKKHFWEKVNQTTERLILL